VKPRRILISARGRKIPVTLYNFIKFQSLSRGEQVWAPEYSFEALEYIIDEIKEAQKHGFDRIIVITGREGDGKSALAAHIATRLGFTDPHEIAFSAKQFLKKLNEAEDLNTVWLDEGGRGLYSRDAMKAWNRDLAKAFMQIRIKRLTSIICIPHMKLLDVHMRNRRVDYWGSVFRIGYKRGFVKWRISGVIRRNTKDRVPGHESEWEVQTYWEPLFAMRFPKFRENNGFSWKEYEKVKREVLSSYLVEAVAEKQIKRVLPHLVRVIKTLKDEGRSTKEIAQLTGYALRTVEHYIKHADLYISKEAKTVA